jgi:drug/metabolite transporter (DMT)-like permease
MTWFWFAIAALLCWSGSDFFSKLGCRDSKDKYSQFKMVMAVGVVMGLHAAYEIFIGGVEISWDVIWTYLPVSLLYIGSMTLGYVGLRYIELSISSPICNASGALVAIIAIVSGTADAMEWPQYLAIALACLGVFGLGLVEANEDEELRAARQSKSNYKYAKSWLALALPIAYCLLDAAGTFADDLVLETLNEDSANVAYELTFLAAGLVSLVILLVKKQKFLPKQEGPKYVGAIFETAGQFAYIYALASGESALAAPIISSYCVASVLWSRIFLKEKLSWKHYACILTTILGIIMGVYDM